MNKLLLLLTKILHEIVRLHHLLFLVLRRSTLLRQRVAETYKRFWTVEYNYQHTPSLKFDTVVVSEIMQRLRNVSWGSKKKFRPMCYLIQGVQCFIFIGRTKYVPTTYFGWWVALPVPLIKSVGAIKLTCLHLAGVTRVCQVNSGLICDTTRGGNCVLI